MLIESPRHKREDLDLWRVYEAVDRLPINVARACARANGAIAALEGFATRLGAAPCYAAVSWGKDSVALAHLVWRLAERGGPRIPVIHVRAPLTGNPDVDLVRDAFLARHPLAYEERQIPPADEYWDATLRGIEAHYPRHITGVRAAEAGPRRIRMRHWGLSTERSCAPIGWWSTQEVFSYLAHHELPVHPAYAMLGGGRWGRDRVRVDFIGGERGREFGRGEWEREYYPEVVVRLERDERNTEELE